LVRRPCAAPTGFEPAYTTVTGWDIKPL